MALPQRTVIHHDNLPVSPFRPIVLGFLIHLLFDKIEAPGWAYGGMWTTFILFSLVGVALKCKEVEKRI